MQTRLNNLYASLTVKQTAALCLSGGLVAASGFLAELPASAAKTHFWPSIVALISPVLLGFGLTIFAYLRLLNGIAAARWPDDEIESLRTLLKSRLAITCIAVFAFTFLALTVFGLVSGNKLYSPIGWACFAIVQAFNLLGIATRREPGHTSQQPTWGDLAPLRSQHWGQR